MISLVKGFNDLLTTHPDIAAQWHSTKNGDLKPTMVSFGSGKKVWWVCDKGHEWSSTVKLRSRISGCNTCSGRKILEGFNDLKTTHPKLAGQWHPVKNKDLKPTMVTKGSNKKVWWLGECGHEWDAVVYSRASGIIGCPVCSGLKVLAGFNDFQTLRPTAAAQWHPVLNGDLKPSMVAYGSNKKVWWLCEKGHEYKTTITSKSRGIGCNVCSGRKTLEKFNDLSTTHPFIAAQWHPIKNKDLKPNMVTFGSHKKVWWLGECKHEWATVVFDRSHGSVCPVCIGQKTLTGFNDIATTHPDIAAQWHPILNGNLSPEFFTKYSGKKVWWVCDKGHEWEAGVGSRTRGNGCAVCSGHKTLEKFNDLSTTHPLIAAQWHPTLNGDLKPNMVTYGSGKKIWWICRLGHEWSSIVCHRSNGSGCPSCWSKQFISKGETQVADYIKGLGLTIKQTNRSIIKGQELDIYVPEKNIAVEYNGIYWHSEAGGKNRNYHYNKWLACKEQGIQLIQIWEDDWIYNPNIVKTMLAFKFGAGDMSKKIFARKTRVIKIKKQQAELFLENNHIQGYSSGTHYVSLQNELNEVVAVIVLRKEKNNVLNIVRFATSVPVIGGFTKLIKYATKTYNPSAFVTFSDNTVSNGLLYINSGFVVEKELAPDYMYVVGSERKHKFGYRLKKFKNDPNLLWDETMTERELAELNKLPRIWDAGKTKYIFRINNALKASSAIEKIKEVEI